MRFCVTVASFDLPQFIELQIRSLRHVFGSDIKILVSDDLSQHSAEIRDVAARNDVYHHCSKTHRGHFAGDLNSTCAALAFAEDQGAEIALKVSQRLILCQPCAREILERYFSDPNIWIAFPDRIHPSSIKRAESRFFSNFSTISDVLAVRTGKLSAETLKTIYEERVKSKRSRYDTLIEALFGYIGDVTLAGHTVRMPEFSSHYPGRAPIYLRRCQSEPAQYEILARELGMDSFLPLLQEWRVLVASYRPSPTFV